MYNTIIMIIYIYVSNIHKENIFPLQPMSTLFMATTLNNTDTREIHDTIFIDSATCFTPSQKLQSIHKFSANSRLIFFNHCLIVK